MQPEDPKSGDSAPGKAWSGRFAEPFDELTQRYTASVSFDCRLAEFDIQGSLAHARMLQRCGILPAAELATAPAGQQVRVAGVVITRQRPASASGVTFVTLEDETGHVNLVVWESLGESQRRELLESRLMEVQGRLQREGLVIHVVAERLYDRSALLGRLELASRDFH